MLFDEAGGPTVARSACPDPGAAVYDRRPEPFSAVIRRRYNFSDYTTTACEDI
jgi:hypothetical protein